MFSELRKRKFLLVFFGDDKRITWASGWHYFVHREVQSLLAINQRHQHGVYNVRLILKICGFDYIFEISCNWRIKPTISIIINSTFQNWEIVGGFSGKGKTYFQLSPEMCKTRIFWLGKNIIFLRFPSKCAKTQETSG